MCGIAGIVGQGARQHTDALERMLDTLEHRGPDARASVAFDDCILGHTRLSIIDPPGGAQPMRSAQSDTTIVFNGAIYGHRDLRRQMCDYHFRTSSDTELLLALREQYGDDMLSHTPGMFAFAIWDEQRRELFAARDRFGEKPFYYARGPRDLLIFASEIKAIVASGLVRPVLDLTSVSHYLQYLHVNPANTIYKNIHCLPPAHSLTLERKRMAINRYWEMPGERNDLSLPDATEGFDRLLTAAVDRQMVADVPVGAFLSGGADSSTIVALASRRCSKLRTFAFGFEGITEDLAHARMVAEHYGTNHTELCDEDANIGDLFCEMATTFDEPFADSSNIATFLISKFAREQVKVVLSGDGADELLAGYPWWYQQLAQREPAYALAGAGSHPGSGGLDLSAPLNEYRTRRKYFSDEHIRNLGLPLASSVFDTKVATSGDALDTALRWDVAGYLPGDILVKTDRASMAHGLELRSPFLDIDLAAFCISLPSHFKINEHGDKLILRDACGHLWPEGVRTRAKQGFGAPVPTWLRHTSMQSIRQRYLEDKSHKVYSVIPFERAAEAIGNHDTRVWSWLVLCEWMDQHDFDLPAERGA